jgi:hypothetical protein
MQGRPGNREVGFKFDALPIVVEAVKIQSVAIDLSSICVGARDSVRMRIKWPENYVYGLHIVWFVRLTLPIRPRWLDLMLPCQ